MQRTVKPLSHGLRAVLYFTAALDGVIGLLFLFGPELDVTLWPSAISPVLMRFIGGIILANAAGSWIAARQGTWDGARALFGIALVYGVIVFGALLYHLLLKDADGRFWIYAAVDGLFLGPIAYVVWQHERPPVPAGAAEPVTA